MNSASFLLGCQRLNSASCHITALKFRKLLASFFQLSNLNKNISSLKFAQLVFPHMCPPPAHVSEPLGSPQLISGHFGSYLEHFLIVLGPF